MISTALASVVLAQQVPGTGEALQWLPVFERVGAPALALICLALIGVNITLWKSREYWVKFAFDLQTQHQLAIDRLRIEQLADTKTALEALERSNKAGLEMAQILSSSGRRRRP